MNKNILIILAVVVVVAAGFLILRSSGTDTVPNLAAAPVAPPPTIGTPPQAPASADQTPKAQAKPPASNKVKAVEVNYTDSGFSPATITVKTGTAVTFKNMSSSPFWPASNPHPIHSGYPGSSIDKCRTSEAANIFDACKGIAPGGSWTFKFDAVGTWAYHDHLNPGERGSVVVR